MRSCVVVLLALLVGIVVAKTPAHHPLAKSHKRSVRQRQRLFVDALLRFNGEEHRYAGDRVSASIVGYDCTTKLSEIQSSDRGKGFYKIGTGHTLSYGQMVALSGDYFGPYPTTGMTESVCLGASYDARKTTLLSYAKRMKDGTSQNGDAHADYLDKADAFWGKRLEDPRTPWPGIKAAVVFGTTNWAKTCVYHAKMNLDHFLDVMVDPSSSDVTGKRCAQIAYNTAHRAALEKAKEAKDFKTAKNQVKAEAALLDAYALNAWADHYLTDMFAAGHIRTPRQAILKTKSGNGWKTATSTGHSGLLANAMHDEDGNNGLAVANSKQQVWWAYGDGLFFDPRNKANRDMLVQAVTASVTEVVNVFCKTDPVPSESNFGASKLWPLPESTSSAVGKFLNPCPMFKVVDGVVKVRGAELYPPATTDKFGKSGLPLYLTDIVVDDLVKSKATNVECTTYSDMGSWTGWSHTAAASKWTWSPSADWKVYFNGEENKPVSNAKCYAGWSSVTALGTTTFSTPGLGSITLDDYQDESEEVAKEGGITSTPQVSLTKKPMGKF